MFAYPCPACHQRLLAPAGRGGQRSICPKCLTPLTVPTPEEVAAGPFAPVAAPTAADDFSPAIDFQPNDSYDPSDSLAGPRVDAELETLSPVNTLPPVDLTAVTEPLLDLPPVELTQTPAPTAVMEAAAPTPKALPKWATKEEGRVVFAPTGLFAGDVAAELSAAISMRMAPPPLPAADRTIPVVGWFVGTAVGAAAWALGVWTSAAWLPYVALVGGSMALFAVLWRAYLSGQRSWAKGLALLLPPLCVLNLLRKHDGHGFRPLLYALTGAALCGLFAAGPAARKWVGDTFEPAGRAKTEPEAPTEDTTFSGLHSTHKADRDAARAAALKAGAKAEPAVRVLLASADESKVLLACDLLEQIGTADTLPALREQADNPARSRGVRIDATAAAEAIRRRAK